jgi:hypothetical protein
LSRVFQILPSHLDGLLEIAANPRVSKPLKGNQRQIPRAMAVDTACSIRGMKDAPKTKDYILPKNGQ